MNPSENKDWHQADATATAKDNELADYRDALLKAGKVAAKLQAKCRNLRMDVKLWKNRTMEAAKAIEDFEELQAKNKDLAEKLSEVRTANAGLGIQSVAALVERDLAQAENKRLKKEIEALHEELMAQAKQFHSKQYCKCNWCQMYKEQALKGKRDEQIR